MPGQARPSLRHRFEGVAVPSVEQRREAAAIGLTCRLMSGNVKHLLKPLSYIFGYKVDGVHLLGLIDAKSEDDFCDKLAGLKSKWDSTEDKFR